MAEYNSAAMDEGEGEYKAAFNAAAMDEGIMIIIIDYEYQQ